MGLALERCMFSVDVARLLEWARWSMLEYGVALGEVLRTEYQQREYVRLGKSKTLASDHLEGRAVDLQLYKITVADDTSYRYTPVWAAEHYVELARYWYTLDPKNYWGYGEWGWDTPHFGRYRYQRLRSWEGGRTA